MPLVASWEVLEVTDVGAGCCPGTRLFRLATVSTLIDGTLRPATVEFSMTTEACERWMAEVGKGVVTP